MTLPDTFVDNLRPYLTPADLSCLLSTLTTTQPVVSLRYNEAKWGAADVRFAGEAVPWCAEGVYLPQRPAFTLDPRLHAGCYYVQEAASQFVTHAVRQLFDGHTPLSALDASAAPGGKSTALLATMPAGSTLIANEIDRKRARILAETLTKWGNPHVLVTSHDTARLSQPLAGCFDLVMADVPCSGEGMFRKDAEAVSDWSPHKVDACAALQRDIVRNLWLTLKEGGLLFYSTCTFNVKENEETLQYIVDTLGGEVLNVPNVPAAWGISGALKGNLPCYRFLPSRTRSEGLFFAVVRKHDAHPAAKMRTKTVLKTSHLADEVLPTDFVTVEDTTGMVRALPAPLLPLYLHLTECDFFLLQAGVEVYQRKGKDLIPQQCLALSTALRHEAFPYLDLPLETALSYLRRETVTLPNAPRGYVLVGYEDHPLGFVKNLGTRSNNLYPAEWRIRHV